MMGPGMFDGVGEAILFAIVMAFILGGVVAVSGWFLVSFLWHHVVVVYR